MEVLLDSRHPCLGRKNVNCYSNGQQILEIPILEIWLEGEDARYVLSSGFFFLIFVYTTTSYPSLSFLLGFSIRGISPTSVQLTRLSVNLAQE